MDVIQGQLVIAGEADAELLFSSEPLSFWGGYDHCTGVIIDPRHPLAGRIAAGKILALPYTVGSSTTTAVLLEAVRARTAPAAILTTGVDSFLALASIVAGEMYTCPIPVIALTQEQFTNLRNHTSARILRDGRVFLNSGTRSGPF